jgi:hypothetical protein
MYKVKFFYKMGPTKLIKIATMYNVNFITTLRPTCLLKVHTCKREGRE